MIDRRDMLFAGACAVALGGAEWLRPRRQLNLLGAHDLTTAVPTHFDGWESQNGGGVILPQDAGSLAARLYAKQIARNYARDDGSSPMLLAIAYGAQQSDELQLHRPEICYPAVGFTITMRRPVDVQVSRRAGIPAVALTAVAEQRTEDIVYWTRLGEYLPRSASEQRRDRLETSLRGYVGDGVLVRASTIRQGDTPQHGAVARFLGELVLATQSDVRKALIGTARADALVD